MTELQSFGHFDLTLQYKDRRAAYAVIMLGADTVVAVKGAGDKYWLPGGGAQRGETAAATVMREVREELGRSVRLIAEIGQTTQYFYAAAEDCYYKMEASFFRAELIAKPVERGEYELQWVKLADARETFFHQCHVWAIKQVAQTQQPAATIAARSDTET